MTIETERNGRLSGKKAVITGGTTGIGFASARSFLDEGAEVLITGRSQEKVDAAVAQLGDGAYGIAADSSELRDLETLAKAAEAHLGRVDILFANAGNGMFAPVAEVDEALFSRQFDLNVKGAFFTVQSLLPLMGDGGSIILTASAVHAKGAPGGTLYFASKAAVRSFARTMAAEFGPAGIRVNTLSPGIVPTQFFENSNAPAALFDDFEAMAGHGAPLGRAGTPEEQAAAAVFLASDESRFMTASDLVNDGGWMNV
ncbi:MAG: SDR family oxidoreductase [Pseudomonadota bacterium]